MSFRDIGMKIQSAREEKGMSQEQLARLIGCSQSALSNYEKGKRRLYLSQLEKMAEILDKPLEYFVETLSSHNNPPTAHNRDHRFVQVMNELNKLSDEDIDDVMNYIRYLEWKRSGRV
jgi:transcriptional regulator with XRE-family HTH domain